MNKYILVLAFVANFQAICMQPESKPLTEHDFNLMRERGYSEQDIDKIKDEGPSRVDLSLLADFRADHDSARQVNDAWGYDTVFNPGTRRFDVRWRSLPRSQEDREVLRSWGFTDADIEQLTIARIHNPLNDERIVRAHTDSRFHGRQYTFNLYASQQLWPNHMPSEADLLLTLPVLFNLDPDGINEILYGDWTVLRLAVRGNYERVVRLLLEQPTIEVNNTGLSGSHSPLELAIEKNHAEIVRLLLSHPTIKITEKAGDLAQEKLLISSLLIKHRERVRQPEYAQVFETSGLCGVPTPFFLPAVYDLNNEAAKILRRQPGIEKPSQNMVKKWAIWSTFVGTTGALVYYARHFFKNNKNQQLSSKVAN